MTSFCYQVNFSFLLTCANVNTGVNVISDVTPEGIGVQINAPPAEGEANTELVRYMSSVLGVRKGDVSLYKVNDTCMYVFSFCHCDTFAGL